MEDKRIMNMLKAVLSEENSQKLMKIDNPELHQFIAKYVTLNFINLLLRTLSFAILIKCLSARIHRKIFSMSSKKR